MTPATAWRCCAAAGVVTFLCSWGFGRIPGLVACGPGGRLAPILAFEFVRSPAEVAALFGAEPCRATLVRAQTIGLLLDGLAFIPAYTAFLCLAVKAASPGKAGARLPPARAGAAIPAVLITAGLADEIEGMWLYRILADLPGTMALIDALWWAVHVKFALLSLGTIGIGAVLAATRRPIAILSGVVIGVGASIALYGLAVDLSRMMAGFTIAWATILFVGVAASIRPSAFSGSANPLPAPASPRL